MSKRVDGKEEEGREDLCHRRRRRGIIEKKGESEEKEGKERINEDNVNKVR